ncbi:hypothetical protein [Pseudomonas xionganensis]|uniref:Uncharacterized protein n=1 Tax=Pseudomonas xionganensis TaxID=2654845 RepID=A0A6I4KUJ9_9PSED|nr:hypothetical protein [Pseudomonas xionganensis]MVW75724.1 hypothetical protein [Pseudomonas xionganensis]
MSESPASPSDSPADSDVQQVETPHPWADLPAERFQLLRLAPLPADRHTGARPLRFVQLGRVERRGKEHSLLRLSLQLPGQRLRKGQNLLEIWADHQLKQVRFAPEKGLSLEPENRGLGRYMLAQAISWARQHYAHYLVEPFPLPTQDAFSKEAVARREHCLKAQGFTIDYLDPLQLKAQASAPRVSSLYGDWHAEKVQQVELLDAAAMLTQADQSLREQDVKIRKLEDRLDTYKREDGSLRFTITCLIAFCVFQAGLLIWIATR